MGSEINDPRMDHNLPTRESRDETPGTSGFCVVGVGASAGGLEAFSELFNALPANTGLGFVLVQHLDPRHESILVNLLALKTLMPVTHVEDGMPVSPDHIYVAPPNTEVRIENRVLRLVPRPKGLEQHRPIDSFFASLAADMHNHAIGVVLSGTASDGTLGLKAIKDEGGITMAQDGSAKFDSMPRSAIGAGVVDFVLPPVGIARELSEIAQHPYHGNFHFEPSENSLALSRIFTLLRIQTGVDFRQYKSTTMLRRLSRRMVLRGAETPDRYLQMLREEAEESKLLFEELLINVTAFFRDPEVFAAAKTIAFPSLVTTQADGVAIRGWVPGCATGEEVYSFAMALVEYLDERNLPTPIQLFGTDVNEAVIAKARTGFFDENAISKISPERQRRFFVRMSAGYQISQRIRELCIFSRHNIAKDPPLSRMDLISCRNLLIYFEPPLQRNVVSTLAYALREQGTLILGPSESLGQVAEYFAVLDEKNKIYSRKANLVPWDFGHSDRLFRPSRSPAEKSAAGGAATEEMAHSRVMQQVDALLLTQFGPTALVVDDRLRIVDIRGQMKRYLKAWVSIEDATDLREAVLDGFAGELQSAVDEVRKRHNTSPFATTVTDGESAAAPVQITVYPLILPVLRTHYLIVFDPAGAVFGRTERGADSSGELGSAAESAEEPGHRMTRLQNELAATREYLQSVIEELRSTNEEAQSANEELQSINEELQTAKEELQSSNEELNTVNAQMQSRNSELGQLNDDLVNLLASMNMPVVMISGDLRIRRFTPLAEKVLHLIPTDVGRPISDIKPRISVPNLDAILQNVLETLIAAEQEVQDVEGNWYLMRVRPYRTSDNRIQGAVLQLLDVSEMRRSLDEVKAARDYAQTIVDTVREPLLVLSQGLAVQKANRASCKFFELPPDGATGENVLDLNNRALRGTALEALLPAVLADGTRIDDLEIAYPHARKGERQLLVNARQLSSEKTRGLVLLAFEDITDRKRAEEARYRRLFEAARDGIIIVDASTGRITDVNPFIEQLCGYRREELVGEKLWDIQPMESAPYIRAAFDQIRDQGVMRFPDLVLCTRDGRTLHTEVVANSYPERNGQAIQLNIRDLTERKKFESNLQHTQKLESLGLLAGGIAHDFNNLLTGILGNASLAYTDTPEDQPTRKFMRAIMDAAERAAFLTQQMLAYAGRGRFVTRTIELGKLVQELSPLVRTSIPKTVDVSLQFDPHEPPVEADPGQLQQVVMNLLINGAEAVPEGRSGKVEIRTGVRELTEEDALHIFAADQLRPGKYVVLEVKDSGIGMDEETKSRIFDPFFTTKFTGRGLGLAAVLGIVRSHKGAIRVYSTLGAGTAFQVLLPASNKPVVPAVSKRASKAAGRERTVLVVDDEEMILNLASNILSRQGFRVVTAANGLDAVEVLSRDPQSIALVLLDLLMPVMGGEEALDRLREIRPDIPVILSSGFDEGEATQRFEGKKITAFVQKPYGNDRLLEAVNRALASSLRAAVQ